MISYGNWILNINSGSDLKCFKAFRTRKLTRFWLTQIFSTEPKPFTPRTRAHAGGCIKLCWSGRSAAVAMTTVIGWTQRPLKASVWVLFGFYTSRRFWWDPLASLLASGSDGPNRSGRMLFIASFLIYYEIFLIRIGFVVMMHFSYTKKTEILIRNVIFYIFSTFCSTKHQ